MGLDAGDETVEEVDLDGRVLRLVTRREMRIGRLRHRSVFVLVRSGDGRVLVHRRSEAKDVWPGWWDIAIGGVVAAGEEWDDAARRELAEEVGVAADPRPIDDGRLAVYDDEFVSLVARCYEVVHDGPFHFADGEVTEAHFVDLDDLRRLISSMPTLPDSQVLLGRHLGL